MSPYAATKKALKTAAAELGIDIDPAQTVFRGGQDPGGWSRKGSLVCIIHEGTGIRTTTTTVTPSAGGSSSVTRSAG